MSNRRSSGGPPRSVQSIPVLLFYVVVGWVVGSIGLAAVIGRFCAMSSTPIPRRTAVPVAASPGRAEQPPVVSSA
jgi:hypothetical protein